MVLQMDSGTFLSAREAAQALGMAYQTFLNKRCEKGDDFLRAHRDMVPGHTFYRLDQVEAKRKELGK